METFAKSIHAVLSNYGYDTAQDRSRVGGNDGKWLFCLVVTLAFDSSPIKGEGDMVGLSCFRHYPSPLDCGPSPQ